jgi:glycosyltransferase involved in cell wall biosynthesis
MPDLSPELKKNIDLTIEQKYELIVIDNSKSNHSIFSAYNEGVERARFPYLCFMHDDILYHTPGWGKKVIDHFQKKETGIIGVLGSHYLPKTVSYWTYTNVYSGIYIQDKKIGGIIQRKLIQHDDYLKSDCSINAVVVDGLWFCIPKELFGQIRFDDKLFNGFHGYDMDISMQVRENNYEVKIISDILIEHCNVDGINAYDQLLNSMIVFNKKWNKKLPQIAGVSMTEKECQIRESYLKSYFELIVEYNKSTQETFRLCHSKAYRIGKFILMPFSYFKHISNNRL